MRSAPYRDGADEHRIRCPPGPVPLPPGPRRGSTAEYWVGTRAPLALRFEGSARGRPALGLPGLVADMVRGGGQWSPDDSGYHFRLS